jgi:hypothetical protein
MALLQWATLAVTLDPVGESGLAHLGLPAQDETWEPPIPPPARGQSAESGQPAMSGRGRRCQVASPRGEGPDLVHRQWTGSPWWARGGEAGRRWGTGDGRPEKRWRALAQGSWSGGELRRRSLQ